MAVFDMDLLDIAEEAWERASGGATELRSGYNLRTARRSLNILLLEWANRGLNLWTFQEAALALVQGQGAYDLPADTVDILEHRIRQTTGGIDLPVARVSMPVFAALPSNQAPGRPIQLMVERLVAAPTIRLWPVPDRADYTLVYWRMRRMDSVGNAGVSNDVPFRFLPALTAGLAYMIAAKIPEGAARLQVLKQMYDESWHMAVNEDREKASLSITPFVGSVR